MRHHSFRSLRVRISSLILGLVLPLAAAAQEEGYAFRWSNFKLELNGGYTPAKPPSLNAIPAYEDAYLKFYYEQRYNAYAPLGYSVRIERTGDDAFRSLDRAWTWGARLKYEFSPSLALAVGIQHLSGSRSSRAGMTANLQDGVLGTYTDRYENQGLGLSVEAWLPQLSAYFGWNIGPVLRAEVFIAGGPMFTGFKVESLVRRTVTDWDGVRSESSLALKGEGTARSWANELGCALRIRPHRSFDVFAEAGYSFRQSGAFSGPGTSTSTTSSSTDGEMSVTTSWDGRWAMLLIASTQSWGKFSAKTASNAYAWDVTHQKFVLEFSAFQIKLGLGVRL
jgi:hypothetical protein